MKFKISTKEIIVSLFLVLSLFMTSTRYAMAQLGTGSCGSEEIESAIGCIPISDSDSLVGWILGWSLGVGGGIAFILIVYASIIIMTSQGIPDRLKSGQELLTSAISGLIMLIFSIIILKFIGIDILNLDRYGFGS